MTQILAGLVGGLLALAGGFLVQWISGRQADRQHARRLAAELLTALRATEFTVEHARDFDSKAELDTRALYVIEFQRQMSNVGHELELLCDRRTAALVRAALDAALRTLQEAHGVPAALAKRVETLDKAAGALEERIVFKLGRRGARA